MVEFLAPVINNPTSLIRLLTNVSDGPSFLNLYNSTQGTIKDINNTSISVQRELNKNFLPKESVFFHEIYIDDTTSTLYNSDKISTYISQNILSDTYFNPLPPTISLVGVVNNTHSLSFGNSGKFQKLNSYNSYNHLSVSYALNSTLSGIKILVYRDIDGISYSEDGGLSCIKIPNNGLSYPNEITSYAIQAHDSIKITNSNVKIFIGTLQEGLKSFTIGKSTQWDQEGTSDDLVDEGTSSNVVVYDNLAVPIKTVTVYDNHFLFHYGITNITYEPSLDGKIYKYIPGNYAPCYILAINNYPITAGNGILVTVDNGLNQLATPGQQGAFIPLSIYAFKYLHSSSKKYSISARGYIETPEDISISNTWISICDPITRLQTPTSPVYFTGQFPLIYDQLKQIPFKNSSTYDSTTSGDLIVVTEVEGIDYVAEIYSLIGFNHIEGVQNRHLQFTKLPALGINNHISAYDFSGLSYADIITKTGTINTYAFFSAKEVIWYCNLSAITPSWSALITSAVDLKLTSDFIFTTGVNNITYLSGLSGFGLFQQDKNLIGIFSSDLGYVQCTITLTTPDILSASGYTWLSNIHANKLRDTQVISDKQTVFSCGLVTEPSIGYILPSVVGAPIKYSILTPNITSNIPSTLSQSTINTTIYKNYTTTESKTPLFYNSSNITTLLSPPNTDQFYDLNFIYSQSVQANNKLLSSPVYNDTYNFNISSPLVSTYASIASKYQKLSLLFQATENITLNNQAISLISGLEVPFFPEISYRLDIPTPGYSFASIILTSTGTGAHGVSGIGNSTLTLTNSIIAEHGVSGTSINTLPIISSATGRLDRFGSSDNTITILSSAIGTQTVIGTSNNTVAVASSGIGYPVTIGTNDSTIYLFSTATGNLNVMSTSSNNFIGMNSLASGITQVSGSSNSIISLNSTSVGQILVSGTSTTTINLSSSTSANFGFFGSAYGQKITLLSTGTGISNVIGTSNNNISITSTGFGGIPISIVGTSSNSVTLTSSAMGISALFGASYNTIALTSNSIGIVASIGSSTNIVPIISSSSGSHGVAGNSSNIVTLLSTGTGSF